MTKEMRRPTILAITVLCLFVLSLPLARTEAAPNLLSYRLEKAKLAQGEPVLADVSIQNFSSQPIDIDLGGNGNENIKISILRPDGQKMERIPHERTNGITFFGKVHLEPNQSYSETLVLNEWFEFNEIGNYSIEIGLKAVPASTDVLNLEVRARDPAELGTSCSELLSRILNNSSAQDSLAAAKALSYIRDPVAVPSWESLLGRPDFSMTAISNLAKIGDANAAQALISRLSEPDEKIRSSIRSALQVIAGNTTDESVRQKINRALGTPQ